jgi:hypothetical protein
MQGRYASVTRVKLFFLCLPGASQHSRSEVGAAIPHKLCQYPEERDEHGHSREHVFARASACSLIDARGFSGHKSGPRRRDKAQSTTPVTRARRNRSLQGAFG